MYLKMRLLIIVVAMQHVEVAYSIARNVHGALVRYRYYSYILLYQGWMDDDTTTEIHRTIRKQIVKLLNRKVDACTF